MPKFNLTDDHKSHIRAWVDALRSGKYTKTEGELKGADGAFCALGVACEVYRTTTGDGAWDDRGSFRADGDFHATSGTLTNTVAGWYGFIDPRLRTYDGKPTFDIDPEICVEDIDCGNTICQTVSEANDDDKDFATIAAGLEKAFLS